MLIHALILLLATLLDRWVGDPPWLWRRLPHPVALIGRGIAFMDDIWNNGRASFRARRLRGALALALMLGLALLVGFDLHLLLAALGPVGLLAEVVVVAVLLAGKSLADHVAAVARALRGQGLPEGRRAVSMIVGRDPEALDEPAVCRAAIESLAENASDGLVAPWLFFLVFGLPGLLVYKVVNTADSMIGHMSERHRAFGWAAARLDDVLNFVPARLTALFFALVAPKIGASRRATWATARRDAGLHRSPNAGWPECAMAGALGLSLGGPRRYGEVIVDAPELNSGGRREAGVEDIDRALVLYRRLSDLLVALALVLLLLALVVTLISR
ncbi:adenosylcobinamide-phosphate synthase CbiB [Aureimonas endophytica]